MEWRGFDIRYPSGREVQSALWLLFASALLSVAISFYNPAHAMLAYLLNFVRPLMHRRG